MKEELRRRKCSYCKYLKMLSDFPKAKSRSLGYDYRCKSCTSFRNSKLYKENKDYYVSYYKNNPDVVIKRVRKWAENNQEKVKAHKALQKAVRIGIIKRKPCVICGKEKVHGHHPDYTKPLEVIWLCPLHHKFIHKNLT